MDDPVETFSAREDRHAATRWVHLPSPAPRASARRHQADSPPRQHHRNRRHHRVSNSATKRFDTEFDIQCRAGGLDIKTFSAPSPYWRNGSQTRRVHPNVPIESNALRLNTSTSPLQWATCAALPAARRATSRSTLQRQLREDLPVTLITENATPLLVERGRLRRLPAQTFSGDGHRRYSPSCSPKRPLERSGLDGGVKPLIARSGWYPESAAGVVDWANSSTSPPSSRRSFPLLVPTPESASNGSATAGSR